MDYKELRVWQESMDLVINVYELIKLMPQDEKFVLSDQIRRAAISIPANIAEGQNRNTQKEFIQFLYIALGSASELETHLLIAQRLGYLSDIENETNQIISIRKMLNALIRSIKESSQ